MKYKFIGILENLKESNKINHLIKMINIKRFLFIK